MRTGTAPVPVVIVGAGGHGRELLDILEALPDQGGYEVLGFVSEPRDDVDLLERRGYRVLGPVGEQRHLAEHFVLAVGLSATRQAVAAQLSGRPVALAHPAASPAPDVWEAAGPGLVMAAGSHIAAGAVVGEHVHLNTNADVGPDAVLGSFVTISPGASVGPGARLDDGVFVGVGAVIGPGVTVGASCVVGAGAVVDEDAPPGVRMLGVPARPR
jgi:sugar O-acyltransferase (sialic acid O-acetyltransferase NeuD family)